jgi:hypothetical protein
VETWVWGVVIFSHLMLGITFINDILTWHLHGIGMARTWHVASYVAPTWHLENFRNSIPTLVPMLRASCSQMESSHFPMAHDVCMNVNIDHLVVLSCFGMSSPNIIMIIENHLIIFPHLGTSCSPIGTSHKFIWKQI